MAEVTISAEEYKDFIKMQARIELFAAYVNESKYSINREDCAAYLGFEVKDNA